MNIAMFVLAWAPLIGLIVLPAAVYVLLRAVNQMYWHYDPQRLFRLAVMTSFAVLAISFVGYGLMSAQFAR